MQRRLHTHLNFLPAGIGGHRSQHAVEVHRFRVCCIYNESAKLRGSMINGGFR